MNHCNGPIIPPNNVIRNSGRYHAVIYGYTVTQLYRVNNAMHIRQHRRVAEEEVVERVGKVPGDERGCIARNRYVD